MRKLLYIFIFVLSMCVVVTYIKDNIYKAKCASYELLCHGTLDDLRYCLESYFNKNHKFPVFSDSNGRETWSWRTVLPIYIDEHFKDNISLNCTWQSEDNISLLSPLSSEWLCTLKTNFSCRYNKNKKAVFVAVKGDGTLWTEVNKNPSLLKNKIDFYNKILVIEISSPTKEWYEPGDDLHPNTVLEMYREFRNKVYQSSHKHIYFLTLGGIDEFANILTEEDLITKLYIDTQRCSSPKDFLRQDVNASNGFQCTDQTSENKGTETHEPRNSDNCHLQNQRL